MSLAGAGAVLDAISRIRRAEREMARCRVRRVVRPPSRESLTPERFEFPCFFLCDECGRLESSPTVHPLRHDGTRLQPGPCPSCQARAWVDLGHRSMALAYREAEATADALHERRGRRWGRGLGLLVGVSTLVLALRLVPTEFLGLVEVVALVTGAMVAWSVAAFHRRSRPGRARPRRWRRPLPRPRRASPVRRISHGVVEGDPLLRTPLGQEPCLGWAVQVWSDEGLLLDEQQHAPFEVDGQRFAADTVTLDLAPRGGRSPTDGDAHLARFMHQRGLSPHDDSLRIYESRLVPGVPVALVHHDAPQDAGPVLSHASRTVG